MENRWQFRPVESNAKRAALEDKDEDEHEDETSEVKASQVEACKDEARNGEACEVEFFIAYEFRSPVFGLLMGTLFDTAFRRFAAAFERRADQVFGKVSPA